MLRRPIMLDEKRLQIGFNEEEIRKFYHVVSEHFKH